MSKGRLKKTKSAFLTVISGVALVLIAWMVVFGKVKAFNFLSPLLNKLPKDETGLTKVTEDILGAAADKVNQGSVKKAIQQGSVIFEKSPYAEPARDVREDIKTKVNEVIETAKDLPAQEINIIKRQVCKEWLQEVATTSGGN